MDDIERYFWGSEYIVRLRMIDARMNFEIKFKKIMKNRFFINSTNIINSDII